MAGARKRCRIDIDNTSPCPPAKRKPPMPPKGKQKAQADTFKIAWTDAHDTSRTERLINWLEEYPAERHMLFSDSTLEAKTDGRAQDVGKTPKSTDHAMMAAYIFEDDGNPEYRRQYAANPLKFTKSVGDRISTYDQSFILYLLLM